jgi:hypothetical protein
MAVKESMSMKTWRLTGAHVGYAGTEKKDVKMKVYP